MVRLQTLDLRIGVRVPASQPFIPKNFPQIVRFPLRFCCGGVADCCGEVSPSSLSMNDTFAPGMR